MINVTTKVVGKILTITVDLSKTFGKSQSGGSRFYAGDKIRIITNQTYTPSVVMACHADCYS